MPWISIPGRGFDSHRLHQIHRFLKTLSTAIVKDVFRHALLPVFLSLLISYSLNNAQQNSMAIAVINREATNHLQKHVPCGIGHKYRVRLRIPLA